MSTETRPEFARIIELQQFIADFAKVKRVPQLADNGYAENDVEHSFGLALTCWYLAPKIAPELSLEKILQYALAHDTVEIHAGDTFIFAPQEELDTKSACEDAALEKLSTEWPDFAPMVQMAAGYKNKVDEEAKFVYAVDKILPIAMVNLGEKDAFWHRYKITRQMEVDNKVTMKTSKFIAPYYDDLLAWMSDADYFYTPEA